MSQLKIRVMEKLYNDAIRAFYRVILAGTNEAALTSLPASAKKLEEYGPSVAFATSIVGLVSGIVTSLVKKHVPHTR